MIIRQVHLFTAIHVSTVEGDFLLGMGTSDAFACPVVRTFRRLNPSADPRSEVRDEVRILRSIFEPYEWSTAEQPPFFSWWWWEAGPQDPLAPVIWLALQHETRDSNLHVSNLRFPLRGYALAWVDTTQPACANPHLDAAS